MIIVTIKALEAYINYTIILYTQYTLYIKFIIYTIVYSYIIKLYKI